MEVKATIKPGLNGTKKYLQKYGNQLVPIKVGFGETSLRETIKTAGAYWDKTQKAWLLSLKKVYALGIKKRIINHAN